MLVRTLAHGQLVINRFQKLWKYNLEKFQGLSWVATDTETRARDGFTGKKDALVVGRSQMRVFSMCYLGESYCFVTSDYDPTCPTVFEWLELFKPILRSRKIVKVFHNANYDNNVFWNEGMPYLRRIYCTMIAAWKANAGLPKGLKERAPLYGRHLGSLRISKEQKKLGFSAVDEASLEQYGHYAEEDVIVTDEIFQTQMFGLFSRPKYLFHIDENGRLVKTKNQMPSEVVRLPEESLTYRDKLDLYYQEFPYLRATLRAEQRGFPLSKKRLARIRVALYADKEKALRQVFKLAGRAFNIRSGPQMTALFTELGLKSTSKTKSGKQSFAADALKKIAHTHPVIAAISEYKDLIKLQEVYVGNPDANIPIKQLGLAYYATDGVIRAGADTVGAVTGRGSSSNPNLTQVPSKKDRYGIKDCFTAKEP
jgi:DNA polymerase I-like protein with 3'-5' exonuclease and polymerase domains